MFKLARSISSNEHFSDAVLVLLVIVALCLGGEATPSIEAGYGDLIGTILLVSQLAFVAEISIRMLAYAPRPQDFFRKFWNSFDFVVVALSLLPAIGSLGLVSRLLRLTRLIRIVSVSGALRNFTSGRAHGISALLSGFLMVGLLWYVMALAGIYAFAATSDGRWASMANGLTSVGNLLIFRRAADLFSGTDPGFSRAYLAVLYLAELAIFLDVLGHLLNVRKFFAGRTP